MNFFTKRLPWFFCGDTLSAVRVEKLANPTFFAIFNLVFDAYSLAAKPLVAQVRHVHCIGDADPYRDRRFGDDQRCGDGGAGLAEYVRIQYVFGAVRPLDRAVRNI